MIKKQNFSLLYQTISIESALQMDCLDASGPLGFGLSSKGIGSLWNVDDIN